LTSSYAATVRATRSATSVHRPAPPGDYYFVTCTFTCSYHIAHRCGALPLVDGDPNDRHCSCLGMLESRDRTGCSFTNTVRTVRRTAAGIPLSPPLGESARHHDITTIFGCGCVLYTVGAKDDRLVLLIRPGAALLLSIAGAPGSCGGRCCLCGRRRRQRQRQRQRQRMIAFLPLRTRRILDVGGVGDGRRGCYLCIVRLCDGGL
jgi:hypothetical protein